MQLPRLARTDSRVLLAHLPGSLRVECGVSATDGPVPVPQTRTRVRAGCGRAAFSQLTRISAVLQVLLPNQAQQRRPTTARKNNARRSDIQTQISSNLRGGSVTMLASEHNAVRAEAR